MFGTVISTAAAMESEELRRTPRDRHAYLHRSCGRYLIFLTGTPLSDVFISIAITDNILFFLTGTPLMQKVRESKLISIAILRIARLVATETNRALGSDRSSGSFLFYQIAQVTRM